MTAAAPPGADAAWRRVPWWARVALVVLAGVLVVELASELAGTRTAPEATTSPSSTQPAGTAAVVSLLAHVASPVVVASVRPASTAVARGTTLLVLDPRRWTTQDRALAASVVAAGGRLVLVGAAPSAPGPALAPGTAVAWHDTEVGPVTQTAPGRLTFGVHALVTGTGALVVTGARVVVAGSGGAFVAASGPVVWVGSVAPLQNAALDRLDDAALAWNLVAPFGRPVLVDAWSATPPATASGFRALPSWWFTALGVAGLAAAAWLASAARRFGPVEARARSLPPPRAVHAEAMGALLERLGPRRVTDVTAPVARQARQALRRTLGLDEDAPRSQLEARAAQVGVPPWVLDAALRPPATRDEAVATGRALAWLAEREEQR